MNPEDSVTNETKESKEKEQNRYRDNEDGETKMNLEESVKNETKESEEKEQKTDGDNEDSEDSEKVQKLKPDEESDESGSKAERNGVKSKLTAVKEDNEEKEETPKVGSNEDNEDTAKILATRSKIIIKDRPTRLRGESRSKYICRLARQMKQRDSPQPTNAEWEEEPSISDTTTSSFSDDDLADSVM